MTGYLHTASSPHIRDWNSTRNVMLEVLLALMPCTVFGIYQFGMSAAVVLALSTLTAVLTEYAYTKLTHKKTTIGDYSAAVTGLMLGLCLSPTVPLYIPIVGSIFAILVVKCAFGGLGQNFMNPALAGRCFLLISFSAAMSSYPAVDTVSGATPLAALQNGGTVDLTSMFFGFTSGTIGVSCFAILLGGIFLMLCDVITWHIPVSFLGSFTVMIALIGGHGLDVQNLAVHLCGGGLMIAAFFMATDPVTCPMTGRGQIIYGIILGVLTSVFRVHGAAAENISFAVILGNLTVPLIDRLPVGQPFGVGTGMKRGVPKAALALCLITLIAGGLLGGVNYVTKDKIAEQKELANIASYQAVLADATGFTKDDAIASLLPEDGSYGNGSFGAAKLNRVMTGMDDDGEVIGYVISVSSADAYDGELTLSVGIAADGTITGITFTELNETPGMGMRCDEDSWKSQFVGKNVSAFVLLKAGGASADNEIDSVSGASTTSGAVVNAVNAAVDFFRSSILE